MPHLLSKLFIFLTVIGLLFYPLNRSDGAEKTSLTRAEEYFRTGKYEEALLWFLKTTNDNRSAGVVGASRTWAMTGEYGKAEALHMLKGFSARACKGKKAQNVYKDQCEQSATLQQKLVGAGG